MFFKRNKIEVVHASQYTDYSARFEELEKMRSEEKYATRGMVAVASVIPTAVSVGLAAYQFAEKTTTTAITTIAPLYAQAMNVIPVIAPQHTGVIADASLTMLANVLDPVIQILVTISFPIASVIMVGACFFFMIGNTEKAWSMIMNAGLGYVLIQLSPLFLEILKTVGEAV